MTPAVRAMLDDPRAPTPPVWEFIAAYDENDTIWWRTPTGHLQNLFESLRDECDKLIKEVREIK